MEKVKFKFADFFSEEDYALIKGIHISKKICLIRPVFKYMKISYLLDLLKSNRLYVSSRKKFEDVNEHGIKLGLKGSFCFNIEPQKLKQEEYNKKNKLKREFICSCGISCWTYDTDIEEDYSSENYLMWKNYTGESGVRIKTTCSNLISSLEHPPNLEIILGDVQYSTKDIASYQAKEAIFTKREFYRDEREMRLCMLSDTEYTLLHARPEILIKEITISPFMPFEERQMLKGHLEQTYQWLKGKIKYSKICTTNNI